MSMPRRTYIALGTSLGLTRRDFTAQPALDTAVNVLADTLGEQNANFDRAKFFASYQRAAGMVAKRLQPVQS